MEVLRDTDFNWHADQPDVPDRTAAQNKAFFDAPARVLMTKVNELVNAVTGHKARIEQLTEQDTALLEELSSSLSPIEEELKQVGDEIDDLGKTLQALTDRPVFIGLEEDLSIEELPMGMSYAVNDIGISYRSGVAGEDDHDAYDCVTVERGACILKTVGQVEYDNMEGEFIDGAITVYIIPRNHLMVVDYDQGTTETVLFKKIVPFYNQYGMQYYCNKVCSGTSDGGGNVEIVRSIPDDPDYDAMHPNHVPSVGAVADYVNNGAVLYNTEQSVTDEQKAQARSNIGSASQDDVDKMKGQQPNLFMAEYQEGNLLDNSGMKDGYRVSSNGQLGVLESAIANEEYIDITKAQGTHLIMYVWLAGYGAFRHFYRMCFYDENKQVLKYVESNGSNELEKAYVEIPVGAVYARTSYLYKNVNATYITVRGTLDTPLELYSYNPLEIVTVPKDLPEKLAALDEMAKDKHQDDTELTVSVLNNSATFSENDITFVGDELWVSKEDATYTNGTKIFRYKVVNGEFTLVGSCDCDFGHLNTMDYCAANDCLIFGNGGNGTETTGNYFVVVKNPLALGSAALIADVGIKYDVDIGFKVQALWGGSNLGDNNIVYLLSNNAANITKVLLLKGDDGEFNGEYVILESHELDVWGVQGADIFGDVLYIGGQLNGNEYAAVKEISLSDYSTIRTVKRKFYSADGTAVDGCVQGIYVDRDAVWICVNCGDSTKPVCLTKYLR